MSKMFLSKGWMSTRSGSKKYLYIFIGAALVLVSIAFSAWYLVTAPSAPVSQELVADTPLTIEVADTPEKRTQGLSGRAFIEENYGMLFVFERKDRHGFWMYDMQTAIDIFWLTDDGIILGIEENVQPETYPTIFYPEAPVTYVLETRAGHARALSLSAGDSMPGLEISNYVAR